jgi:NTP pyrophosphatase (non-canonical NTP hydrolase)
MTIDELTAVTMIDDWLDSQVAKGYQEQPLAQDWARVAKATEEAGEAVDALIRMTGQNPRKGTSGTLEELLGELADVAWTGVFAIQHFTKDAAVTDEVLRGRLTRILDRVPIGERHA